MPRSGRISSDIRWPTFGPGEGGFVHEDVQDMFGLPAVIGRRHSTPLASSPDQHGDPTTQDNEPVSTQTAAYNVVLFWLITPQACI